MFRTSNQLDVKTKKLYQRNILEILSKKSISNKSKKAWHVALTISKILKSKYNAKKVIVFGSLVKKSFNNYSDIDIGVAGIPPDMFFKAVAGADALSKEFNIDIIDIEDCSPDMKKELFHDGIDL